MVCYILDGYNVLNKLIKLSKEPLAKRREYLIKFLVQNKPQGSYKNKIIIVFDSSQEFSFPEHYNLKNYNIQIIFTSGETADEKIKQIVKNLKHPKEFVVVTNDKEVRYYVRYYGVKVLSVEEFIKPSKQKVKLVTSQKFDIDESELQKINEELKKKYNI